jgi:hypothetical protein
VGTANTLNLLFRKIFFPRRISAFALPLSRSSYFTIHGEYRPSPWLRVRYRIGLCSSSESRASNKRRATRSVACVRLQQQSRSQNSCTRQILSSEDNFRNRDTIVSVLNRILKQSDAIYRFNVTAIGNLWHSGFVGVADQPRIPTPQCCHPAVLILNRFLRHISG